MPTYGVDANGFLLDEQGLPYALYDPIRFGPNYDYVTGTTAGQREFGAEYRDDFGSPFINTFNETFPNYGYDPALPHTYDYRRPYDPGADDGGSAPFQRFLADIREGVGPGYERAVGLLRQAGYDDTAIRNYRINALNDAGRTDAFAFLGDQFFPAVALFGIAAGGAGLSGGFAAEGGAGAGAGGATSFAGPAVEGGELTGTAIGLNSGTTLGGAGAAGGAGAGGATSFAGPAVEGGELTGTSIGLNSGTTLGAGGGGAGLTAGQVLRAGQGAVNLGTGIAGAVNGGGGSGGNGGTGDVETDALYQRLRALAAQSAPQEQALALEGERLLQQRAAGSPAALLRQLSPQVRELRKRLESAYTNVSRRLGSTGGAQIAREQGQAVGQAGEALQKLFAGGQAQGQEGLYRFLRNLRPALLTQLPQLQERTIPFDYQNLGRGLSGALTLGQRLFTGNGGGRPPLEGQSGTPAYAGDAGYGGYDLFDNA